MGESLPSAPTPQLRSIPDGAPVSRQLEGLAHAYIVSRRSVGADARYVMPVGLNVARIEADIPAEIEETEIIQPRDAIGDTSLHRRDGRLLVIEEEKLQRLDAGRATPVMRIGFYQRAVAGDQLRHDEGSGAVKHDSRILCASLEHDYLALGESIEKIGIGRVQIEKTVGRRPLPAIQSPAAHRRLCCRRQAAIECSRPHRARSSAMAPTALVIPAANIFSTSRRDGADALSGRAFFNIFCPR